MLLFYILLAQQRAVDDNVNVFPLICGYLTMYLKCQINLFPLIFQFVGD